MPTVAVWTQVLFFHGQISPSEDMAALSEDRMLTCLSSQQRYYWSLGLVAGLIQGLLLFAWSEKM